MASHEEEEEKEEKEQEKPIPVQPPPSYSNAELKSPTAFSEQLVATTLWALAGALRARERGLEWLAAGLGLAGCHLIFVVVPRETLTFLDVFIIILYLGCGLALFRFERDRGLQLQEFSQKLKLISETLKSELQ